MVILPVAGDTAAACTEMLVEMILKAGRRAGRARPGGPLPDLEDPPSVSRWIAERRGLWHGARFVLLGARHGPQLLLQVYALPEATIAGLKSIEVEGERCEVSARDRVLLMSWIGARQAREAPHSDPVFSTGEEVPLARTASAAMVERPPEPLLVGGPELALFSRTLEFKNPRSAGLRGYRLGLVPVPGILLRARPLGSAGLPGLVFGLRAHRSLGLSSEPLGGGVRFPSALTDVQAHVEYAFDLSALAQARGFHVAPRLGLRHTSFRFFRSSSGERPEGTPEVRYSAVVLGLVLETELGERVRLGGALSHLPLFDLGPALESRAYFQAADGASLALDIGLELGLAERLALRIEASYLGTFVEVEASGHHDASGLSDQLLSLRTALLLRL